MFQSGLLVKQVFSFFWKDIEHGRSAKEDSGDNMLYRLDSIQIMGKPLLCFLFGCGRSSEAER
ncbi:unnamed protein product [Ectocarpus sp. CCAP 1310/34]|nr:unnamed protein product [Ectocarpus sp. CCAP 1310/34]